MQKFIIKGSLPSMNEIIEAAKSHYGTYSKMKKEYTELVKYSAYGLKPCSKATLIIKYYCKDKRKDKDNIAAGKKFILDGLQAAQIISNDNWVGVEAWKEEFYTDKTNPRIEVEVIECNI